VAGVADNRRLLTVSAQNAIQTPVAGMIAAGAVVVEAIVSPDVGRVSLYASYDGSIEYKL
jgi:hypothetical protein